MPAYKFSRQSLRHLSEVHPFLRAVAHEAIRDTQVDFGIIDGARSESEQAAYFDRGVSKTLDSLHFVQSDGWAWAFDAVPYVPGRGYIHTNHNAEEQDLWDKLADAMWRAATRIGVSGIIEWGGHWSRFSDLAHWQLKRRLRRYVLEA